MKRSVLVLSFAPAVLALGVVAACGDDTTSIGGGTDAGGGDGAVTGDIGGGGGGDGGDGSASDSGGEGGGDGGDAGNPATVVAKFSATAGELAEGLTVLGDAPLVGFAPAGKVVTVADDGGTTPYASFASPSKSYTLGLATNAGAVYVAVAQTGASPSPTPGVYKVASSGATPSFYGITTTLATQPAFPNGLDFVGTDLYVTDSANGVIYKINGTTTLWSQWLKDSTLVGDEQDCKLGNGFPIGANGIAHDANNFYVVNTDKGTLLKIPFSTDAGSTTPVVMKKDPSLCGADGLVLDKDGTFIVAVNAKDTIVRISADGSTITTIASGPPLDTPASVFIQSGAGSRRLLVTNAAFKTATTAAANPALLAIPLPP